MQYNGKYKMFDSSKINASPLSTRTNKVKLENLVFPKDIDITSIDLPANTKADIETIAKAIVNRTPDQERPWPYPG